LASCSRRAYRRRPVSTKQQRKSVRAGEIVTRHLEPVLGNEADVLAVGSLPVPTEVVKERYEGWDGMRTLPDVAVICEPDPSREGDA
jgi:hypothetical protein